VFAVEASNMANVAKSLVLQNDLKDRVTVIHSPIEDLYELPGEE